MGTSSENGGFAPFQINYNFADGPLDSISPHFFAHNASSSSNRLMRPLSIEPVSCDAVPPGLDPTDPRNSCPCQECSACLETAGTRLLDSILSRLSSYERLQTKIRFALYTLSTCGTVGLLLYIFIIIVVLVYFLIFNSREQSSYDGESIFPLSLLCLSNV